MGRIPVGINQRFTAGQPAGQEAGKAFSAKPEDSDPPPGGGGREGGWGQGEEAERAEVVCEFRVSGLFRISFSACSPSRNRDRRPEKGARVAHSPNVPRNLRTPESYTPRMVQAPFPFALGGVTSHRDHDRAADMMIQDHGVAKAIVTVGP